MLSVAHAWVHGLQVKTPVTATTREAIARPLLLEPGGDSFRDFSWLPSFGFFHFALRVCSADNWSHCRATFLARKLSLPAAPQDDCQDDS